MPLCFAAYLTTGDTDNGLAWLERAYDDRDEWLLTALTSSFVDPVRSDPRLREPVAKVAGG